MSNGPYRILVVDDHPDIAESLARVLRDLGHDAEFLTEPQQALAAAKRMHPDLVFLDIGMPVLDGYELARLLRQEFGFESLRLVAITAWGRGEDRAATRRAGFDAHVTKPADIDVIQSIMDTMFAPAAPARG